MDPFRFKLTGDTVEPVSFGLVDSQGRRIGATIYRYDDSGVPGRPYQAIVDWTRNGRTSVVRPSYRTPSFATDGEREHCLLRNLYNRRRLIVAQHSARAKAATA